MAQNKLAVIIPFYKRPELTKLCFSRLKRQAKKLGFDVIVAGSEGEESEKIAKGLKYIEVPNQPLGRKLNALIKECEPYDGVILLGSDDFMSDSVIKMYQEVDCTKEVYYVFDDVYVYSAKLREVRSGMDFKSRPCGVGIGRMYTKAALQKANYHLWENDRHKGLDGSAAKRCRGLGIGVEWVELGDHFLIDAKVEDNITSHNVVLLRDTIHPLSIMNKLGATGKHILNMEFGNEKIYDKVPLSEPKEVPIVRITCKVLKSFNEHKEGDMITVKDRIYRMLFKGGFVS